MSGQSGAKAKTSNLLVWIIYSCDISFKKLYILLILYGDSIFNLC